MATLALSLAGQVVGGAVGGPIGATIGRALGALAGSAIDSAIFAEAPAATAGSDLQLQGSSEGAPIPKLYGWSRLSGNIIWATQLERLDAATAGAKGTSQSTDTAEPQILALPPACRVIVRSSAPTPPIASLNWLAVTLSRALRVAASTRGQSLRIVSAVSVMSFSLSVS